MKTIYLIRHAKSDWGASVDDIERPLNDRGRHDAPMMAMRMLDRKAKIDTFLSSPAKRALSTARAFAAAYGRKKEDIRLKTDLYLSAPETFFSVIEHLHNTDNHVAIFSHNNGITDFANALHIIRIDNMPTCSIFAFRIKTDNWNDFRNADKEFLFFDYPKK